MRHRLYLLAACLLALQWIVLRAAGLAHDAPLIQTVGAGVGIFGAAFLLSWAAEAAQVDIPQALAIAFLALIAVLPEYAVDMYFAWQAPHREGYTSFATANMTGANRLLIGLGWGTVVAVYWWRHQKSAIELQPSQSLEVFALLLATLYSFVLPLKATISLWDSAVLGSLFVAYMVLASRQHHAEPEIEGPAEWIASFTALPRRAIVIALFAYSGVTILLAAEPFAEGLIATGRQLGIEEFILVQWLAPLASESPEFIVCILFAWMGKPNAGIGALLSSAVNQWTLLVGMLPVVYSLSAGRLGHLPLDDRQVEEVLLTSAQSAFAIAILADLRFGIREALVLLALFASAFCFTQPAMRYAYSALYIVLTIGVIAFGGAATRRALFALPAVVLRRPS